VIHANHSPSARVKDVRGVYVPLFGYQHLPNTPSDITATN
jgi:hypothetical protein